VIYTEPRVTVVARPAFFEPEHLPVHWMGESTDGERLAEFAGRLCYMSQANPAHRTTRDYLENIKRQGHGSVLEHASYSLLLEGVSRSLTHELVRHRAGWAFSQLSQRYVDESQACYDVAATGYGLAQGVAKEDRTFVRELDLRYVGQSADLTVTAPRSLEEPSSNSTAARRA